MNEQSLTWQEFERVEMRVGTIIEVNDFPKARKPAYQLRIDFGQEIGILQSSAQLTVKYKQEDLLGLQVVAVVKLSGQTNWQLLFSMSRTRRGGWRRNGGLIATHPSCPQWLAHRLKVRGHTCPLFIRAGMDTSHNQNKKAQGVDTLHKQLYEMQKNWCCRRCFSYSFEVLFYRRKRDPCRMLRDGNNELTSHQFTNSPFHHLTF